MTIQRIHTKIQFICNKHYEMERTLVKSSSIIVVGSWWWTLNYKINDWSWRNTSDWLNVNWVKITQLKRYHWKAKSKISKCWPLNMMTLWTMVIKGNMNKHNNTIWFNLKRTTTINLPKRLPMRKDFMSKPTKRQRRCLLNSARGHTTCNYFLPIMIDH